MRFMNTAITAIVSLSGHGLMSQINAVDIKPEIYIKDESGKSNTIKLKSINLAQVGQDTYMSTYHYEAYGNNSETSVRNGEIKIVLNGYDPQKHHIYGGIVLFKFGNRLFKKDRIVTVKSEGGRLMLPNFDKFKPEKDATGTWVINITKDMKPGKYAIGLMRDPNTVWDFDVIDAK